MNTDEILDIDLDDEGKINYELVTAEKFMLLFLLSLSLYGFWWMYKKWSFFKEKENLDIMPAARAFFAIFFLHTLLEKILNFAKKNGYPSSYSSTGLFVLFIILNLLGKLPEPYSILSVLAGVALLQPVKVFNYAIEQSEIYRAVYPTSFNQRQIAIILIGGIFWMLILIGLFAPEDF